MTNYALYLIGVVISDVLAIMSAKFWQLNKNPAWLMATIVLFGLAGFLFARSLAYGGAAITNILWISGSTVIVTLIGYFYFHENITLLQMVGIAVVILGLILIELK